MAALFKGGSIVGLGVHTSGRGGIGALGDFSLGAFPGFDLVVHGIFVALPVVLTAEAAWAVGVGAAVGTGMALEVFTVQISISHQCLRAERLREAKQQRT